MQKESFIGNKYAEKVNILIKEYDKKAGRYQSGIKGLLKKKMCIGPGSGQI